MTSRSGAAPAHAVRARCCARAAIASTTTARRATTCASSVASASATWPSNGSRWPTHLPAGEPPALVADVDDLRRTLVVRTAVAGDFSTYTLALVAAAGSDHAGAGFDPLLSEHRVLLQGRMPVGLRLRDAPACPPPQPSRSRSIDYLAKDYAGFRRLMLDRLACWCPAGANARPPTVGVDAGRTAGLRAPTTCRTGRTRSPPRPTSHTARQRISVRRHARLVDYPLHEGCNARAWVHFEVSAATTCRCPRGTALLTPHRPACRPGACDPASRRTGATR